MPDRPYNVPAIERDLLNIRGRRFLTICRRSLFADLRDSYFNPLREQLILGVMKIKSGGEKEIALLFA